MRGTSTEGGEINGEKLLEQARNFAASGQHAVAGEAYWNLSDAYPRLREPAHNAGFHWRKAGDFKRSLDAFRRALSVTPWLEEAQLEVALSLSLCERHEEALEVYAALLVSTEVPNRYLVPFGHALARAGRFADAVSPLEKHCRENPNDLPAVRSLAAVLYQLRRFQDASIILERGLQAVPDDLESIKLLARCLREMNRFGEAGALYLRAADLRPTCPETQVDLGGVYARIGRLDMALVCFQKALEINPKYRAAFDNVLGSILCVDGLPSEAIHRLFKKSAEFYPHQGFSFSSGGKPPLRVGFVSADFCRHPVSSFLIPLVENIGQSDALLYFYHNSKYRDTITKRLLASAHAFREVVEMGDEEVCHLVRRDGIDVLVDLAGHFSGNRLGVFCLRAAPVQVTMIGCMFTTGLAEMDYRVTDAYLDPTDEHSTEKLVRFESGAVCLAEPDSGVEPGGSPCRRSGSITFGSFNNLAKVSSQVIDVWADVLKAIPSARLMIVAEHGNRLREEFEERGVDASLRVELCDRMEEDVYLAKHQEVDVLLDTFPYNGFTVTLLAAWMGVPCLTLEGDLPSARTAAAVMSRLGLGEEFVARSPSEFVAKACRLASDFDRLSEIRSALRSAMFRTWMDGKRYAAEFLAWIRSIAPLHGLPVARGVGEGHATRFDLIERLDLLEKDAVNDPPAMLALAKFAREAGFSDRATRLALQVRPRDLDAEEDAAVWIELVGEGHGLQPEELEGLKWTRVIPEFGLHYLRGCSGEVGAAELSILHDLSESDGTNVSRHFGVALARRLVAAGETEDAEKILRRCITSHPESSEAYVQLSDLLATRKEYGEALMFVRKAYALRPSDLQTLGWCGVMLYESGLYEDAILCLKRVLKSDPLSVSLWLALSLAEEKLDRWSDALSSVGEALRLHPSSRGGLNHRGWCELRIGRPDLAYRTFEEAIRLYPDDKLIVGNYLYCSNYPQGISDEELFDRHRRFESFACKMVEECGAAIVRPESARSGKIKVGFISPDFFDHSVSYFLLGVLKRMDRTQFEISCYHCSLKRDGITVEFEQSCDHFKSLNGLTTREAVQLVIDDGLDVAIDLAGHTGDNRLELFAFRLAPVQMTMIGAMQTTGLSSMDYRVTDGWMDPEGLNEDLHTEKLLRLGSGGWVFCPPANMPEVGELPALKNGFITFGTFNNLAKCNELVMDSWASVLHEVPDSRLMIVAFDSANLREGLVARGVSESRIIATARSLGQVYYKMHHSVDIALDTFPFNGLTVSCFAAWMGVPTLSFAERRTASRVGYAIASRLGLESELVAETRDALPLKAAELARGIDELSGMRRALRGRMESSLANVEGWTREFQCVLKALVEDTKKA